MLCLRPTGCILAFSPKSIPEMWGSTPDPTGLDGSSWTSSLGPSLGETPSSRPTASMSEPLPEIPGIIFYNDLVFNPFGHVSGRTIHPVALPLLTLPSLPQFNQKLGYPDVTIHEGETGGPWFSATVRTLTVEPHAVVTFADGVHEIANLDVGEGARVECAGTCEMHILNSVKTWTKCVPRCG